MYMPKNIHIVEDDEDIRYIIGYILSDMGYSVKNSETITDFKKQVKTQVPDMILLDVMLPDGNGLDLCQELKQDLQTNHIPILIMSAHANLDEVNKLGCAQDFIAKPFDLDHLTRMVKKYLPA